MATENNFLKLDINNFNEEIFFRLSNQQLTLDDCIDLFADGFINKETLLNCCEYLMHNSLLGWDKSTTDIDKETIQSVLNLREDDN